VGGARGRVRGGDGAVAAAGGLQGGPGGGAAGQPGRGPSPCHPAGGALD